MGQTLSVNNVLRTIQAPYYSAHGISFRQSEHVKGVSHTKETKYNSKTFRPGYSIQNLPLELLLMIFSQMELKPYIISHGVCKEWKQLLPLANIHPIRRRLFNLFHHMLQIPHFLETRRWTLENLKYFDRKAYIDALLSQYPAVPAEFCFWILEWPARMVLGCSWPGLPHVNILTCRPDKPHGVNWLGWKNDSPTLLAPVYRHRKPNAKFIPTLLIWRTYFTSTWLIFDKDEPNLFGKVYASDEDDFVYSTGAVPSYDNDADPKSRPILFQDWIAFQEDLCYWAIEELSEQISADRPDDPITYPVQFLFGSTYMCDIPCPPWTVRHDPSFQHYLQPG